jgi:hypothetical protein
MKDIDIQTLEKYLERYPWYSAGYLELYRRISIMDEDAGGVLLNKAASHVYSRSNLYRIKISKGNMVASDDILEISEEISQEQKPVGASYTADEIKDFEDGDEIILEDISDIVPGTMPRFVLAGGDYFSREEFELLELDRSKPLDNFIAEKPSLLRASPGFRESATVPEAEIDTSELFDDAAFYTETLAKIYLEQGFSKRALDVYAKLILLYPEKSAYFATLVKDIKNKYNC